MSWRERAKLRPVEGFSPGRGPASSNSNAFAERAADRTRRGSAQMSCQAGVRASMGGGSTWLGREENSVEGEEGGRKEWQGGRQKKPRPCVSKAQLIHC